MAQRFVRGALLLFASALMLDFSASGAVGPYTAPSPFTGILERVEVRAAPLAVAAAR